MLSECGGRVGNVCGCCYLTGGYDDLSGLKCVVGCDVCGAFTRGCQAAVSRVQGGCAGGKLFSVECCLGGNATGSLAFCRNKFGGGGPVGVGSLSGLPGFACRPAGADLVSELGTRGYRLYKTISGLIVRRIEGLGGLRKGAAYRGRVVTHGQGAVTVYNGYCGGLDGGR